MGKDSIDAKRGEEKSVGKVSNAQCRDNDCLLENHVPWCPRVSAAFLMPFGRTVPVHDLSNSNKNPRNEKLQPSSSTRMAIAMTAP